MWYVYMRNIETGREEFINSFPAVKDAIRCIAGLYQRDLNCDMDGDYYYFMKKR